MAYSPEQREKAIEAVIAGLSEGIPLAVVCRREGMPNEDTIGLWAKNDEALSRSIARARELGWDHLAAEALAIADTPMLGETVTEKADGTIERKKEDMLGHRKLQIETRLKLLAKWDPKRYGELIKHGNADGSNIDLAAALHAGNAKVADAGE